MPDHMPRRHRRSLPVTLRYITVYNADGVGHTEIENREFSGFPRWMKRSIKRLARGRRANANTTTAI